MFSPSDLPRFYVPPMAGVTDLSFRRVLRHVLGSEYSNRVLLATEMISGRGTIESKKIGVSPRRMKLESDEIGKVVVQLFGHEPEVIARAATEVQEAGAFSVDINMGCPVPKIIKSKDGAYLLREPELARKIIKAVRASIKIPLSVKTRLGWSENEKNILEFARMLEGEGIDFITIHGRTRAQGYSGNADWKLIGEAVKILRIPVFVNGDIDSEDKARQAFKETGAHGIAVARGVIGNPWLILRIVKAINKEIDEFIIPEIPDISEIVRILNLHLDWIEESSEGRGVHLIKKHLGKYLKGFKDASEWRLKMCKSSSYEEMKEILRNLH